MELVIDVQTIVPPERHPFIFQKLSQLNENEGLTIVNDHDPQPLLRQLEAVQPGIFKHEYLQAGPVSWKVKITKIKTSCCGFCGGE